MHESTSYTSLQSVRTHSHNADVSGRAASPSPSLSASALPTLLALAYVIVGYLAGFSLLALHWPLMLPGILLLAHSLIIAAFLLHECTHQSLFSRRPGNVDPHVRLGLVLAWITGACYSPFAKLREKHLRHHFERADIVAVDYRALLLRHPLLRRLVEVGQWCCLPAIEILLHVWTIVVPFIHGNREQQCRVAIVVAVRATVMALLISAFGVQMLFGYVLAYGLFITVMGFMDAYQHQYLLLKSLQRPLRESPTRDHTQFARDYFSRDYEQAHTFSNLISRRWPWLNLLVLNFCYHNAHHYRPGVPWYQLPALHNEMNSHCVVPFKDQSRHFFSYRVERVMALPTDDLSKSRAVGAGGVSFLTAL